MCGGGGGGGGSPCTHSGLSDGGGAGLRGQEGGSRAATDREREEHVEEGGRCGKVELGRQMRCSVRVCMCVSMRLPLHPLVTDHDVSRSNNAQIHSRSKRCS